MESVVEILSLEAVFFIHLNCFEFNTFLNLDNLIFLNFSMSFLLLDIVSLGAVI